MWMNVLGYAHFGRVGSFYPLEYGAVMWMTQGSSTELWDGDGDGANLILRQVAWSCERSEIYPPNRCLVHDIAYVIRAISVVLHVVVCCTGSFRHDW